MFSFGHIDTVIIILCMLQQTDLVLSLLSLLSTHLSNCIIHSYVPVMLLSCIDILALTANCQVALFRTSLVVFSVTHAGMH